MIKKSEKVSFLFNEEDFKEKNESPAYENNFQIDFWLFCSP